MTLAEFEAVVGDARAGDGAQLARMLAKPLLIAGGLAERERLARAWTGAALMGRAHGGARLRYVTPAVAKASRSFDAPEPGGAGREQLEAHMITFERCARETGRRARARRGGGRRSPSAEPRFESARARRFRPRPATLR